MMKKWAWTMLCFFGFATFGCIHRQGGRGVPQDPPLNVTTSGMTGTAGNIPAWTTNTNIEATSATQPGTVGGNLFIAGPNSIVDISAVGIGGIDDALINSAGTTLTTAGVTTLTIGTDGQTMFNSSTDVNKVIAIAGGGLTGAATAPTLTQTCSAMGHLAQSTTYFIQIAYVVENTSASRFLSEGLPSSDAGPPGSNGQITTMTCGTGLNPFIVVTPPSALPTGVTAYAVYAGLAQGAELQQALTINDATQPAVCKGPTLAASGYNACPIGINVRLQNIFPEGPQPPTVSTWQTTIFSVTNPTTVKLTDPVLNDVTSGGVNVVWGTDNNVPTTGAFTKALNQCVAISSTNTINATTLGCRIRFSVPSGAGHTGRYLMATTPRLLGGGSGGSAANHNIVLEGDGGLGVTGLSGTGGTFTQIRPTPEIIVGSRVWGVQAGNPANPLDITSKVEGLDIEGLAFEDAIGQAFGGVALMGEVDGAFLDRVSLVNFTNGACLYMDGGAAGALVQIATIHKIRGDSCKYGIRSVGNASDIEIDGGTLTSSQVANGIGIDIENNPLSTQAPGNMRIHDIAIRDFPTHIKLVDMPAASIVQIKEEQTATAILQTGTGIDLESNLGVLPEATASNCTGTRIAFPVIAALQTGINVGANCSSVDIYKPVFSNLGATTIADSGSNTTQVTDQTGITLGTGLGTAVISQSVNILVPNQTSTGTALNELASLTTTGCASGVSICATTTAAGATSGAIGIVVAGFGTTGNAVIAVAGIAKCNFVSAPIPGHYVVIANAMPGLCKDSGSTSPPASNEYLGILLDSSSPGRVALTIQRQ